MFERRKALCRCALPTLVILASCFGVYKVLLASLQWRQSPTGNRSKVDAVWPPMDEQVRDCITGEVLGTVRRSHVASKPFSRGSLASWHREQRNESRSSFQMIYREKIWSAKQPSGPGSTVEFAARACRTLDVVIELVKRKLNVERVRILDVPCGDMTWMAPCLERRPDDTEYTGYDIVSELIEAHRKRFVDHHHDWTFQARDIVADGLDEAFDIVFSRMMLQHLLFNDVLVFLDAISRSGSRLLLTTSFPAFEINFELPSVDGYRFRQLNLEAPPVSLLPPVCYTKDGPNDDRGAGHYLHLWTLPLRQVLDCSEALPSESLKLSNAEQKYWACVEGLPTKTTFVA